MMEMKFIGLVLLSLVSTAAFADLATKLNKFNGYTIVGSETIVGWYDKNSGKKGDSFEGCEYGRVIIFENNKALTCAEYGYHYAYRPTAVILSKNGFFKMVVDDEVYEMTTFI
jgi:hypothetical protein